MSFRHFSLHKTLLKALDELSLVEPTAVQEEVIPAALWGRDLRVNAETGSGKTLAFLAPAVHRSLTKKNEGTGTRILVLVPTRELAQQVFANCQGLIKYTNLTATIVCGGDNFGLQMEQLEKRPDIIIATPGRLVKHVKLDTTDFSSLDVLVLDEADRMLDLGFSRDMQVVIRQCNPDRQTMLFSATLGQKGLRGLVEDVMSDPETITLSTAQDPHSTIQQQIVLADDDEHKHQLLQWLLQNESYEKALVFTNSRRQADHVRGLLVQHELRVGVIHGDIDQEKRNHVMGLVREGSIDILVATEVAARGLDIEGIDLVINFDMARRGDNYVHRIGRTGRAGKKGLAISLVSAPEWNLMASVERYLKLKFERRGIKALKGTYSGPKKLKKSGKAAGSKKKKTKKKSKPITKQRNKK